MARMAHEDIAEVLASIANVMIEEVDRNPAVALAALKISTIITDFLEDRSENLIDAYDRKLNIKS